MKSTSVAITQIELTAMITIAKLLIAATYVTYMTKLYKNDSFGDSLIETIGSIAHAIVIVSISLLLRLVVK